MDKYYKWDTYCSSLLMISFFLPMRIQIGVLVTIFFYMATRDLVFSDGAKTKNYQLALFLGCIYFLYPIYLPFTVQALRYSIFFSLEQQSGLLSIPLIFASLNNSSKASIYKQLLLFVFACLLSCSFANVSFLIHLYQNAGNFGNHVHYRIFFENTCGIHPTFMGMYLSFSCFILLFEEQLKYQLKEWQFFALFIVLFISLFALLPKTPIIGLMIGLSYYFIAFRKERKKIILPLVVSLILAAIVVYFLVPFAGERVAEIENYIKTNKTTNIIDNSMSMRKLIWSTDWLLIRQNWLWGMGSGNLKNTLEFNYFLISAMVHYPIPYFNTHNQFANIWLCFGIFGLLLFCFILFYQIRKAIQMRNHLHIFFLILVIICCTTEDILLTQRGLCFYSFFGALFIFYHKNFTPTNQKNHSLI
ncbi:MAG: O-antigen ligase family protein [Phycisphaerales bacterium]|nr:O-antigen ligase family protein [Phycisphaerales bacterium]